MKSLYTILLFLFFSTVLFGENFAIKPPHNAKGIIYRHNLLYQNQTFTPRDIANAENGVANGRVQTWQGAKKYCQNLTLGRYYDWRVPSYKELKQLISKRSNRTKSGDKLYITRIMSKKFLSFGNVWSSTEVDSYDAKYIDFSEGITGRGYKKDKLLVLCVRDAKPDISTATKSTGSYDIDKTAAAFRYLVNEPIYPLDKFKKLYKLSNFHNVIAESALLLGNKPVKHSKKDIARRVKILADNGDVYAQYFYGRFLQQGTGITKNTELSIDYLKKAALSKELRGEALYRLLFSYNDCTMSPKCHKLDSIDIMQLFENTLLQAMSMGHLGAKRSYDRNFNNNGRTWGFWQGKHTGDAYIYSRYKKKKLDAELRIGWENGVSVVHFLINRKLTKLTNITLDDYFLEVDDNWLKYCNRTTGCIKKSIYNPALYGALISFKDFDNLYKYKNIFLNHSFITLNYKAANGKGYAFSFRLNRENLKKSFDYLIDFHNTTSLKKADMGIGVYNQIKNTEQFIKHIKQTQKNR